METVTDKNKMQQNKLNSEDRIGSKKNKFSRSEIDWTELAINTGLTILNGAAFAAGGLLMKGSVDRWQNRAKSGQDLTPDNIASGRKQMVGHA